MPQNRFAELHKYYSDFVNQFFSQGFLTPDEVSMFARQEEMIGRREQRVRQAGMSEAAARGLLRSGEAFESIMAPRMQAIEEAWSALDFERAQMEEGRRQQAFQMAFQAMKEDEERRRRSGGLWGGILGTALGVGASFIPGIGPVVGPAIGGMTSRLISGGDGGGDFMNMLSFLNMTQGQGDFGAFLEWLRSGGQDLGGFMGSGHPNILF